MIAATIKFSDAEKQRGGGVGFDRIRRITGYLVGTVDRFNDAKTAEVRDRVKHTIVEDNSSRFMKKSA